MDKFLFSKSLAHRGSPLERNSLHKPLQTKDLRRKLAEPASRRVPLPQRTAQANKIQRHPEYRQSARKTLLNPKIRCQAHRHTPQNGRPAGKPSDAEQTNTPLNLRHRDTRSLPTARAMPASLLPVLGGSYIRVPEWPCSALPRPRFIDPARAALRVEHHAIAIFVFQKALPQTDAADVGRFEFRGRKADLCGKRGDFFRSHPDVAGVTRAAVAASGALETQASVIPHVSAHR